MTDIIYTRRFKLQRAMKYEAEHGVEYDWLVHVRCDSLWCVCAPRPAGLAHRQGRRKLTHHSLRYRQQ